MHTVYISVGSNIGDKLQNCRMGINALTTSGHTQLKATSAFYKTEPVDYTDQEWFINAVVKIATSLEPLSLLDEIIDIQRKTGRVKETIRFGPRVLDLDILLYDNLIIDTQRLTIPHPRMHNRRFVLRPICDIDPHIIHPVLERSVQTLLDTLAQDQQRIVCLND